MFTFSVVMCLYNVEEYLRDAIDSILSQTIGFRDNIQLILVNDGSKDRSGEICSEYQRKFPENIVIAERENGGLSSARNLGLTYACGKYVNFADADDLWEPDAFEKVLSFFNSHENEVDAVTCRIRYFGRSRGFLHGLDYKFRETRIIDITKEPSCLVQHVCSSFFRAESIKDLSFDASLTFGDDVDFSYSGGKDSTVLLEMVAEFCKEYGYILHVVFCDTGLEYPEIRMFAESNAKRIAQKYGVEMHFVRLKPDMIFRDVIIEYGYPVISKEVSKIIYGARHSKDKEQSYINKLKGLNPDGTYSEYKQQYKKYEILL